MTDRSVKSSKGQPKKCLWFTKGLGRGGVERLLVDMYGYVDRDDYHVDIAYVLPWKNNYRKALEDQGARVFCLGSSRSGDPRWMYRLNRLLRAEQYELLHTHAPLPSVAARTTPFLPHRPAIVHTEHNMWERYRWPTKMVNAATYHLNREVVAVSDSVAATIRPPRRFQQPPVTTIHHGTVLNSICSWNETERRQRRAALGLPEEAFLIGNVGNMTAKKDHRNLLQAIAADSAIADAHLVLVGLGPLEEELKAAALELGVAKRTTFLGSRDDVFEILPLFDLFCVSSQFEGFPIALVEAMATGLPCVATSVGGIPEIIDDGESGLLVPAGDSPALRRAIERLMNDPWLAQRCGDGGRVAAEKLDLRHAVRALETLYARALDSGGHDRLR